LSEMKFRLTPTAGPFGRTPFNAGFVRAILMLCLAALCLSSTALHAGTLDDIRKRGSIRLGYSETNAPFSFRAKDDSQPAGYSVDLCMHVASRVLKSLDLSSLKIEWVPLDSGNRIEAVLMQRVDIECGTTTATLSRRREVDFSLPIFADASTLIGRQSVAISLAGLAGKRIAVTEFTTTEKALKRASSVLKLNADVVPTRSPAEAFALLKAGKVDAMAGDRTVLVGTFLLQGQAEGLVLFDDVMSYEPYALALRRGDAPFRLLVDTALADLYRSGEIVNVVRTWLEPLGTMAPAVLTMFQLNALPE
jgi:glutamate/aspartate transport system substrate-binding protein